MQRVPIWPEKQIDPDRSDIKLAYNSIGVIELPVIRRGGWFFILGHEKVIETKILKER